jgi:hypothetical protein
MKPIRSVLSIRLFAGLLIGFLFATFSTQTNAQTAAESRAPRPSPATYDRTNEITLDGTVQEVISEPAPGSPVGVHLLVAGPQGTVDAHLGPYLSNDTRDALRSGESVRIVGAMKQVNGKDYLLARRLILGGRTVTVRTERGFLVHASLPRASSSQAEQNGGLR